MEGKAKEAFEKWYFDTQCEKERKAGASQRQLFRWLYDDGQGIILNSFIIEWLDSVGIVISVMVDMSFNHSIYYDYTLTVNSFTYFSNETYKSRQEATEAAIKKAVEIYNEKYKEQ